CREGLVKAEVLSGHHLRSAFVAGSGVQLALLRFLLRAILATIEHKPHARVATHCRASLQARTAEVEVRRAHTSLEEKALLLPAAAPPTSPSLRTSKLLPTDATNAHTACASDDHRPKDSARQRMR